MKKIFVLLMLLMVASFVFADPGWVGGIWPNSGDSRNSDQNIDVYVQIWVDGVTNSTGQGDGVTAVLYYKQSTSSTYSSLPMSYNTDIGNNDEYTATIPSDFTSVGFVNYYCVATHNGVDASGTDQNNVLLDSSSPGTLTINEAGTPITLASFTAKAKNGVVEVAWETASEMENSHFLVYRDDAVIAQIGGAGTTSETNTYAYVDDEVLPGVHEYALADVTYDGKEVKHDAVMVEVGAALAEANFVLNKAYPNPFNPSVTLSLEYAEGTDSEINIYNTQGILVETLYSGYMEAGKHELNWNASHMQSGVYIVKMIAGNVNSTQKLVLMK